MDTVLNVKNVDTTKQPMFLGEDLALQRYDRFKYPKFFDLWRKQEEFHWLPEEVSLTKDRNDYENLNDTERFIFNSNLRWQTMTDSMLSRSIHNIKNYVSNPELEICMTSWARFETIHSYSYTYTLQNIAKDATAFFDSILEDKEITKRATEISQAYNTLLGDDKGDIKQKIFNAVLSTQITEGLAFYVSFACTFAFGELKLMEGSAKIISFIARDEATHLNLSTQIIKKWQEGDDPQMKKITEECKDTVRSMYKLCVEEEKAWARHLFKDGSIIGLNEKLLGQYVEFIANKRLRALGYDPLYDIPANQNPLPWTQHWLSSKGMQVAPQETEVESYIVGGIKQDVKKGQFSKFKL